MAFTSLPALLTLLAVLADLVAADKAPLHVEGIPKGRHLARDRNRRAHGPMSERVRHAQVDLHHPRPKTMAKRAPSATPTVASTTCQASYAQCGGIGYSGSQTCCCGTVCTKDNDWWYYCNPLPAASTSTCTQAAVPTGIAALYGQCGGQNWNGPIVCALGSACIFSNQYYSQCLPVVATCNNASYGQCGGQGWSGATCCPLGYKCVAGSQWYSQCLPV